MTKQKAKAAIRQAVATAGILKVEKFGMTPAYHSSVNLKYLDGDLDEVVDRLFDELINANVIEIEEPLELWVNIYEDEEHYGCYRNREDAERGQGTGVLRPAVHFREVVEE